MRRVPVLLLAVALTLVALPVPTAWAAPAGVGSVGGTVRNAADGTPVPDALIELRDGGGRVLTTKTDPAGAFSFGLPQTVRQVPLIQAGVLTLTASRPGFSNATETFRAADGSQSVHPLRLTPVAAPSPSLAASPATAPGADSGPAALTLVFWLVLALVLAGLGVLGLLIGRHRRRIREPMPAPGAPADAIPPVGVVPAISTAPGPASIEPVRIEHAGRGVVFAVRLESTVDEFEVRLEEVPR